DRFDAEFRCVSTANRPRRSFAAPQEPSAQRHDIATESAALTSLEKQYSPELRHPQERGLHGCRQRQWMVDAESGPGSDPGELRTGSNAPKATRPARNPPICASQATACSTPGIQLPLSPNRRLIPNQASRNTSTRRSRRLAASEAAGTR